ncbi:MAG: histidine--tRNA ligase [Rhodobacteraceae bacterium]|nr:histidine--tRNA ligase [Paracoccaceae bacterium]MBR29279.1 histidine--tRNA ligase [Paracoccaceae bacterium]
MAKDKKPRRPRAETPRGFRDYFGAEVTERAAMLAKITQVYHAHGFDPLESSAVETVEALGKFLPDVDRPNEGVFAWQDEDESWLALRYDLTAPLARVYAQHRNDLPNPYRRYAVGPVWRNEKPGPGRFRQFYQCDADTVGSASPAADAEICGMLAQALENAGIARGDYQIRLNNRKILNGVLEVSGILDPKNPEMFESERGIVLRAIDKLDRLGESGVADLLGAGRKDASGDFTKGAELNDSQIESILKFVRASLEVDSRLAREASKAQDHNPVYADFLHQARDYASAVFKGEHASREKAGQLWNRSVLDYLGEIVGDSHTGWQGVEELRQIVDILAATGYSADRVRVDPSVVRGLGYYTGAVYEAELTFEILDEKGRPRQFGSVAGGGRYDDLVKRFTGQAVPATGVSIGVDRLLAALRAKGRMSAEEAGPVVVTAMDRDRLGDYQAMAAELRAAGIRAEVFLGGGNMGKQLKYADKRAAPVAVIEGGDEKDRGVVQIKDLALGARLAADIETNEDWKAQPAQMEIPRAELVAQVRAMLARAAGPAEG